MQLFCDRTLTSASVLLRSVVVVVCSLDSHSHATMRGEDQKAECQAPEAPAYQDSQGVT